MAANPIRSFFVLFFILFFWCPAFTDDSLELKTFERYRNMTINVSFRDTDIDDVIRIFADKMNINIIRNNNVKAKITANLKDMKVFDALDLICRTHSINYLIEESITGEAVIRIYTQKDYLEGLLFKGTPLVIKLKYTKAQDVYKKLEEAGSIKGKQEGGYGSGIIYADDNSNAIIIIDKDSSINKTQIKKIIEAFDQPTPQVLLEAKILSVSLNDSSRYGIRWDILWQADMVIPFEGDKSSDFSAVKTWKFNDGSGSLTAMITALSEQGDVKVLSNPRLVVLNGKDARIIVGKNEPYTVTTTIPSGGSSIVTTDTKFIEVGIGLEVTPQINDDNVILKIAPNVSSAAERKSESVAPTVTKSQAATVVTVKNKNMLILGGLIETKQAETIKRVPILGHIPLLGYLFSSRSYTTIRSELVFFIRPTIINGDYTINTDIKNLKNIEKKLND